MRSMTTWRLHADCRAGRCHSSPGRGILMVKTDILSGECTYSTDRKKMANVETISARRAREIIELNRQGEKPLSLLDDGSVKPEAKSADLLADGDLSRFDKFQKKKKKKKKPSAAQPPRQGRRHSSSAPTGQTAWGKTITRGWSAW